MRSRIQPLSLMLFAADMVIVPLALWSSSVLRSTIPVGTGGALPVSVSRVPLLVHAMGVLCWAVGLVSSQVYNPELSLRWFKEAGRAIWGATVGTALMAGLLYLSYRELSRLQFLYFFVVGVGLLLGLRAVLRISYRAAGRARPGGRSRILIIGAGELGNRVADVLLDHSRWGYEPIGFLGDPDAEDHREHSELPILGRLDDLRSIAGLKKVHEVWVALPVEARARLEAVISALASLPVRVKVVPDYSSLALVRANAEMLSGIPIIGLRDPLIEGIPRLVKRGFDLLATVLLLIPALPIMGLIAVAIRLGSPGPPTLKQRRVGENGRIFEMFKFRTMVADAEDDPQSNAAELQEITHKMRDDPRVTKVGRFLRRYSLDELPQLFNVLRGDMSLVGPRPEMPWLVERYEPWQRKRFAVPQGLTGWWQINGRSDKPMHLNTEDDLYYVYNYSLWLDIQILVRTPWEVLRGRGAF